MRSFVVSRPMARGRQKPDGRECDVGRRDAVVDGAVAACRVDEAVEHVACCDMLVGPVGGVEQRVDDVDHAETSVNRCMHVSAERLATGGRFGESSATGIDGPIEHVDNDCVQERLLVGKVSIQSPDTDARSSGDCVSGGLAADLEDQLSRSVEELPTTPQRVSSHRSGPGSIIGHKRSIILHLSFRRRI